MNGNGTGTLTGPLFERCDAGADERELDDELDDEGDAETRSTSSAALPAQPTQQAPRSRSDADLPGLVDLDDEPDEDLDDVDDGREWPVVLLDGEPIRGPFYRPAPDGGPMLEVYDLVRKGRKLRRGSHQGRIAHYAGEEELLDEFGPGTWYLFVRSPAGQVIAGRTIRVGRQAAKAHAERVTPDPSPSGPARTADDPLVSMFVKQNELLVKALEAQAATQEKLQRELIALQREKAERETELREQELQATRDELRTLNERIAEAVKGPAAGTGPQKGALEQITETLEQAERLKSVIRDRFGGVIQPEEPEGDFADQVGEELDKLGGVLGKLKQLKDLGGSFLEDGGDAGGN